MTILPFIASAPAFQFSTEIDGASYTFDVRWNGRARAWYFNVLEDDGTPIAYGLKLVLGAYLGRGIGHDLFRLGVFVARDNTRESREASLDDLGTRVEVLHVPIAELLGRLAASWSVP